MRIVGGRFKGRTLQSPATQAVRPTSDRLRESLFNILTHWNGRDAVAGSRVIDLFAGTGALGLEALSRGASFGLFVDDGSEARALLRENIQTLGLAGSTRIFRRDATKLGAVVTEPFTLALLDPPYAQGLAGAALESLESGGWLAPGALVIVEEAVGVAFTVPATLTAVDNRQQGDSHLHVFTRQ